MDRHSTTPFVAPDVIALLCRNNNPIDLPGPDSAVVPNTPKPEIQGNRRNPNWKNKKRQPYIKTTSTEGLLPTPPNSFFQNNSLDHLNNGRKNMWPRGQRRYSEDDVSGVPRRENIQSNHYNLRIKSFKEQKHTKKKFSEQTVGEKKYFNRRSREKKLPDQVLRIEKYPDQTLEKKVPEQELREEKQSDLVLRQKEHPKLNTTTVEGCTVKDFITRNTGVIPKTVLRTQLLLEPSYDNKLPEEATVKMSLDSSIKLKLLIIQHHFLNNLQAIKTFIKDNYTNDTVGIVVQESFSIMLKKDSHSRGKISMLISDLMGFDLILNHHVVEVLSKMYEDAVLMIEKYPLIWTYLAELTVPLLVSDRISFLDLQNAGKSILKTKSAKNMLIPVFQLLIEKQGIKFLESRWKTSGVNLSDFIPHEEIDSFVKENKLNFFIEQRSSNLESTEKLVQTHLEQFIIRKEHFEHVSQFVLESLSCIGEVFVNSSTNELLNGIFSFAVIKDENSAEFVGRSLSDMIGFGLIRPEIAAKHMSSIFEGKDIEANPQVLQNISLVFAHLLITKQFSFAHICTGTSPILKTPLALNFFLKLFEFLLKVDDIDGVESSLKSSGISLYDLVDSFHVKDLVKTFGFHDLKTEQTHPTLNIQEELVEMIKNCEKVKDIKDWISVHVKSRTKDQDFVRLLMSAVCEGAITGNGLNTRLFHEYSDLISSYVKTDEKEMSVLLTILKLITKDDKDELAEASALNHRLEESVGHQGKTLNNPPKIVQNPEDTKQTIKASLNVKVKQLIDHQKQTCNNNNNNPKKVQNQGDFKHTSEVSKNTKHIDDASLLNEKVKQIMEYQIKAFNDNLKIGQNRGSIKHTSQASSKQSSENIVSPQGNVLNNVTAEVTQGQDIGNKSEARAQTPISTSTKKESTTGDDKNGGTQSLEEMRKNIIESMRKGTHFRHIKQCIDENFEEISKGSQFLNALIYCLLEASYGENTKTFRPDNILYYGKLLKLFTEGNIKNEIIALCAFQDIIKVRPEPNDLFLQIFDILWMQEFISEEAFLEFLDSKISGDVLKVLSSFYEKLMNHPIKG